MIAYVDSSVVLRVVLGQRAALKEWPDIVTGVTSGLLEVECLRTIDRLRHLGALDDTGTAERREAVYRLLEMMEVVEPTAPVLGRAAQRNEDWEEAERLYREIFTVEQAGFKDAMLGYFKLLIAQNKPHEVLVEYDQLLQQPARASWAQSSVASPLRRLALSTSAAWPYSSKSMRKSATATIRPGSVTVQSMA